MKGIFELNTPSDLLAKLERDYVKLCEDPLNVDAAFNYFVTASCMVDWVYPDQEKARDQKESRTSLRNSNLILQICDDVATGAKHFTAKASHHKSVSETKHRGSWGAPFADPKWFNVHWGFQGRLDIMLDGDAMKAFGECISSQELAERLLDFWKDYLANSQER